MALRPHLYDRLVRVFGDVKMVHEDEEMVFTTTRGFLDDERRRMVVHSFGEAYAVCCPFCLDTRYRLWINHRWALYERGVRKNLWLAKCFNEDCLKMRSKRRELYRRVFVQTRHPSGPPKDDVLRQGRRPDPGLQEIELPGTMTPIDRLPPETPARRYLEGRGYDVNHLSQRYGVMYPLDVKPRHAAVAGRIVIPVYMRGRLVGWQARRIGDLPEWKATPKYLSCPGMKKSQIL